MCGWHQGLLKKFLPSDSNPYLIRWTCKPPIEMQVSEKIIRQLVWNYKYCQENDIFEGIVGREILWIVNRKAAKPSLRVVKVIRFPTKGSRLYELAFRDGNTMDLTPEVVDRACARDERIRNGMFVVINFTDPGCQEVMFTLAQMNISQQEKANYPITRSPHNSSRNYGTDFSSSASQDGDITLADGKAQKVLEL